jgi:hypothetical protein
MSFVIRKSSAGDGQSFLVLDLENLCANATIAQALVREKDVSGSLNVKVKTNRPYRVAYGARPEGAAYLRERENDDDPVLALSAGGKTDCDMFVSEVIGPNQYFERTFRFDSEAIKEGCLYVFSSTDAEAPFEGTVVVNVDIDGEAEPRFTAGRKRGRQPASRN